MVLFVAAATIAAVYIWFCVTKGECIALLKHEMQLHEYLRSRDVASGQKELCSVPVDSFTLGIRPWYVGSRQQYRTLEEIHGMCIAPKERNHAVQ